MFLANMRSSFPAYESATIFVCEALGAQRCALLAGGRVWTKLREQDSALA